jgi:hypothetical protein
MKLGLEGHVVGGEARRRTAQRERGRGGDDGDDPFHSCSFSVT